MDEDNVKNSCDKELSMRVFPLQGSDPASCFLFLCLLFFILMSSGARAMPVFINELHYDNVGGDVGEAVELAGLADTDLQGWRLWFYNGGNGRSYASLDLSGVFVDQQNGYGVLSFAFAGIQNGSPDGIALVDGADQLQQFISYEGAFTALDGVAVNHLSIDIGVVETTQTAIGMSLQLTGNGSENFLWQAAASSFGSVNALQQFNQQQIERGSVANASSWWLLALGLFGVVLRRSVKKQAVVAL